jgi:hypothetical protein
MSDIPKSKRRWLQFSLRGLLLLMAVAAAPLSWTANRTRQQREALAALEKLGCTVEYRPAFGPPSVLERLKMLLGLENPRAVTCITADANGNLTEISDAELVHLGWLTQLELLNLNGTLVTDASLVDIQELPRLRFLGLRRTQITDTGLSHLRGLVRLQWLSLGATQITDAGLMHLRGLNQLEILDLRGTQVTDAGLVHLQGMPHLHDLDLVLTQVTDAGVRQLQRALPKVDIDH